MSTITSTTVLFNQLRTYCYNIETDSKKLRRNVEKSYNNKTDFGAGEAEVQRFIDSLSKDAQSLHAKIDSVEEILTGPRDISQVTTGELLDKSVSLLQANKSMIETLNIYVAKFSAAHQTSSKSKVCSTTENNENCENNAENVRSSIAVDSSNRTILGDITSTCEKQPLYNGSVSNNFDDNFDNGNIGEKSVVSCGHDEEFSSPHNMSSVSDSSQNPFIKTPNLEEWKLSESTRSFVVKNAHLAPENRRRSMLGASELFVSTTPLNSNVYSAKKSIMSSSRQTAVENMKLQTPQQLLKSCHLLAANDSAIDNNNYSSPTAVDTPETPTIGTPFQTCDLRTKGVNSISKMLSRSEIMASLDCEATFNSAPDIASDLNNDFISDEAEAALFTDIPTLPVKKTSVISVPIASIPSILQSDWDKAPSFLKLQVTIEDLNMSLLLLNRYIEKAKNERHLSVDMFTQEEMESILCGEDECVPVSSLKAIILGLVTLKRLDLGNENKVKVFRIKKSY